MVIVPQSAFIASVSESTKIDYIEKQLATLREQLEYAQTDRSKNASSWPSNRR